MTKADQVLGKVLHRLGLSGASPQETYAAVDQIIASLKQQNQRKRIPVKTTGTILERLCAIGLKACLERNQFETLPLEWRWLADFSITGRPLNVLISVKSFKARERLLMSGSGSPLAPTIGFGYFTDPSEWNAPRIRTYVMRGFVGIYAPTELIDELGSSKPDCLKIRNVNGRSVMRPLRGFGEDLAKACIKGRVDSRLL